MPLVDVVCRVGAWLKQVVWVARAGVADVLYRVGGWCDGRCDRSPYDIVRDLEYEVTGLLDRLDMKAVALEESVEWADLQEHGLHEALEEIDELRAALVSSVKIRDRAIKQTEQAIELAQDLSGKLDRAIRFAVEFESEVAALRAERAEQAP